MLIDAIRPDLYAAHRTLYLVKHAPAFRNTGLRQLVRLTHQVWLGCSWMFYRGLWANNSIGGCVDRHRMLAHGCHLNTGISIIAGCFAGWSPTRRGYLNIEAKIHQLHRRGSLEYNLALDLTRVLVGTTLADTA